MSLLPPETLPIWQRLIIIIMMSGRSANSRVCYHKERSGTSHPSPIIHHSLSAVSKAGEEPRFAQSPPPRQEANKASPDWMAAAAVFHLSFGESIV